MMLTFRDRHKNELSCELSESESSALQMLVDSALYNAKKLADDTSVSDIWMMMEEPLLRVDFKSNSSGPYHSKVDIRHVPGLSTLLTKHHLLTASPDDTP